MPTTPAATGVVPSATIMTPRCGWQSGGRHGGQCPPCQVVLTLPQELHALVRRHPKDLYDRLRRAAAQALITLAMDPHDVGGLMGVWCRLHTWTRTLTYHPPVHGLVPAGGVSADRTAWRPARTSSLVPVHALAKLFRGLFLALVRQERPDLIIPEVVWTTGWVVYCKPAVHRHGEGPARPGPLYPPYRADQPPSPLHRYWPGVLSRPGRPGPALANHDVARPRVASGAFCRRCCPTGSTTSATMGCGVPAIGPSCTNGNAAWRGTPPPPSHRS